MTRTSNFLSYYQFLQFRNIFFFFRFFSTTAQKFYSPLRVNFATQNGIFAAVVGLISRFWPTSQEKKNEKLFLVNFMTATQYTLICHTNWSPLMILTIFPEEMLKNIKKTQENKSSLRQFCDWHRNIKFSNSWSFSPDFDLF